MKHLKYIFAALGIAALLSLAESATLSAQAPTGTNYSNCIFWNLAKADVILLPNKSAGYYWTGSKWEYTKAGNNSSSKLQYIVMDPDGVFDGNPEHLPHASKPVTKPSGGTVEIVNQSDPDVGIVLNNWKNRATAQGHPSTSHRIVLSCNQHYQVCIDNVWSTFQEYGQSRITGGMALFPQMDGATFDVYLKGDNRFGNIFYCSQWQDISEAFKDKDGNAYGYSHPGPDETDFTKAKVVFHSATSAGSKAGTLVVGNITPGRTDDHTYFDYPTTFNFYDAVIGGSDGVELQNSRGIKITGGTIYAGAEEKDVCSAIGGGGNGIGLVTITGGSVTAVTSSTGTAIGGGIGWTDYGGEADVTITGGEVYAYNHGIVRLYNGKNRFVPAAAIGGGSSFEKKCWNSSVNISGGTVYAQSVGGVAIGGGGSAMGDGSNSIISISGSADVKAKSVTQVIKGVTVPFGTSIGGGVGGEGGHGFGDGTGGSCTFSMTGGKLRAGSIGGGSSNSVVGGKIGYAKATISGANTDIQGQFIMAAGGSEPCSFTMSAGNLHDSSINDADYKIVKNDGGALWLEDPTGVVTITGGTIQNCKANNGGAVYTTGGTVSIKNATIQNCQALTGDGGAFAVMASGATVTLNTAQILKNTAKNNGGAFFLNPNAKVTITTGTIDDNKATQDGGAFYGSDGSTITLNSGSIERNSARNGGGVYLASGAKLTYTTSTSAKGYIKSNTASQMGGGVYLAEGTSSKKTQLEFVLNSTSLGFYDNFAEVGADDIYAYGEGKTRITIPDVTGMDLGGYSLAGATLQWWEDYKVGDNRYSVGTMQGDASNITRYRASRDAALPIWKVPKVETTPLSNFYEKYLCLTLGFEYGSLEIRRSGLKPKENAIYKVEFQGDASLNRPAQYVTVRGTKEDEKISIDGVLWNLSRIGYLPKGPYKVTEIPWAWYITDKTTSATVKTQNISTEAGRVYTFSNDHEDLGTGPLHDEESKPNDFKP